MKVSIFLKNLWIWCEYRFFSYYQRCFLKEAKDEVKDLSLNLIQNLESKIHKSAKDTLEAIAKGFGAKRVEFEFKDNTQKLDVS